jgi:hypothetical protein
LGGDIVLEIGNRLAQQSAQQALHWARAMPNATILRLRSMRHVRTEMERDVLSYTALGRILHRHLAFSTLQRLVMK